MNKPVGLLTTNHIPVPLSGVRVEGDVIGRSVKLTVRQKYRNTETRPVEAVYKFPLPEGGAVAGFRIWIGERMIEGIVEEREKAFDNYDDALIKGHGAYLMDEERPNIFTLSAGNLNPGMEVTIEIDLVLLMDSEGHKYRLTMPTTISPRYVPVDMPDDEGIPAEEVVNPQYAPEVPYGLSLLFRIHHAGKLAAVESPSHPVRITLEKDTTVVELTSDTARMDHDFILVIDPGEKIAGKAYRLNDGRHTFWQLDLFLPEPEFDRQKNHGEIIFLLDCSGSMGGESIREAKKALEICLKALPANCTFNVYRFGSSFNAFFKESRVYSEASLTSALRELDKTDASLGGTEMVAPFEDIYRTAPTEDVRSIVLLTDGEVGNEQQLLDLVSHNRLHTRVYPIGIGAGPNEYLIKGLARTGNGAAEFVYPGERIEPKVLRMFTRITGPKLEDPEILWTGANTEQAPVQPVIFTDMPSTIYARTRSQQTDLKQIRISGTFGGRQMEWVYDIEEVTSKNMPLPQLWAHERIRDLEESPAEAGSRQRRRKELKSSAPIIELSKTYGILSRYTSYLGIEKRSQKDKTRDTAELRKVPTLVTTGWHDGAAFPATVMQAFPAPLKMMNNFTNADFALSEPSAGVYDKFVAKKYSRKIDQRGGRTDILMLLLAAQQPGGGFLIDDQVAKLLEVGLKDLRRYADRMKTGLAEDAFLILSTALIFEILTVHFSGEVNIWRPLTEKSRSWLADLLHKDQPEIDGQSITDWAENFVTNYIKMASM